MDKPLSAETQSQIRALCESIAQRDQLGEDVQEELRGHIEDKVISYLEGREALTEQDTVILAREHFGSANLVRSLLFDSHPPSRWRPWVRASAELVTIALLIDTFICTAHLVVVMVAAHALDIHALVPALRWLDNAKGLFGPILLLCVLLTALRASRGNASILPHLSHYRLIALFTTAIVLWAFIPEIGYRGGLTPGHGLREGALSSAAMLIAFATCTTWIAFSVRGTGALRLIICSAFVWAALSWALDNRYYWPSSYLYREYDPSREWWVDLPKGTIVCDYTFYGADAAASKYIGGLDNNSLRFLTVSAMTLFQSFVNAAVGTLCYLVYSNFFIRRRDAQLGQPNIVGFQ